MSQDRHDKIQDMLLARIEELFTKYDDGKSHEGVLGNAHALERIALALQAVGHPSREIAVGSYAAPVRPVDSEAPQLLAGENSVG